MSVKVELDVSGKLASGTVSPTAGASIEIEPAPGKALTLSLDYRSKNELILSAAGTMTIAHTGLALSGGIDRNLLNGNTELTGKVSYTISKDVAAVVLGQIGSGGAQASAGITVKFG
jgi:hypothetical protein